MSHLILVVPCYNEADRLDPDCFHEFEPRGHRVQFSFVNDGSRDETGAVLRDLAASAPHRFAATDLQQNVGKAEAVRTGILSALEGGADFVGFWDADLSPPLEEIPNMIRVFFDRPAVQAVNGSRVRLLGHTVIRQTWRHLGGRGLAAVTSLMLGLPIHDTLCGGKIYRVSPGIRRVFERPFVTPWLFDIEILIRVATSFGDGGELNELVYEWPLHSWRHKEGSKLAGTPYARAAVSLLKIRSTYRTELRAMRRSHKLV